MLALCLCAALLCGCGSKPKSLWGKDVHLVTEPIPAEALEEGSRCVALSSDGGKLLISGGGHIYLWERESGKRLSLTPGDETTEALLREFLAKHAEAAQAADGPELVEACFGNATLRVVNCPGKGNWLVIESGVFAGAFLLDTDSGKLYGEGYLSACGDELLRADFESVSVYNRKTGETRSESFTGNGEYDRISLAAFLPDGSICATLSGENGTVLVIRPPSGEEERYPLGLVKISYHPINFWPVGSDYLVLVDRARSAYPCLLIDRRSGSVSLLTAGQGQIRAIPQATAMDKYGSWKGEYREHRLVPVQSMSDGETILMTGDSGLMLFRPESGETQKIPVPEDAFLTFGTGNGYDLLFQFPRQELYRLSAEN